MNAQPDTFGRFLDVRAADLDDHEACAEDRAFAAYRRILVLGALETAGIADLGNGDPRLWVADAA